MRKSTTPMTDVPVIRCGSEEPRVDSRDIAKRLGIKHHSAYKTIKERKADFEQFGLLRFEIQVIDGIPMTTTKKTPTKLGSMAGSKVILVADSTAAHPILIAHPAHPTVATGQNGNRLKNALVHHADCGIISTKAKAPVIQNTFVLRSNRPDSAVSLCPNSVTGLGADGPFREAGRTASTSVLNICPPMRFKTQVDLKTCTRSMTMPKGTPTGKSAQITHTHHQTELLLRASNHLALALFQLRNTSGDQGIRTACGHAAAASRSLKQLYTTETQTPQRTFSQRD